MADLTKTLMKILKTTPLVLGATAGMWVPSAGGSAPVMDIAIGNWYGAIDDLSRNYIFYDEVAGKFEGSQGRGVKIGIVGLIIHKVLVWIDG